MYISDSAVVKLATQPFWYQFKLDAVINRDDVDFGRRTTASTSGLTVGRTTTRTGRWTSRGRVGTDVSP